MRVFWRFLQLYLLLFFVCLAESLYAAPKYYFKQISLENGLSQSSVKCVLVDERGVMWIGTRFGLNRFDREKITVYQEERENLHSLPYNDIVFLEEDAEGNIWVGTSRGLACFERDTQKFMRQEIDGQPLVAACSLLMPEGIYFLGKQGVFCYSYAEKKMIRCKFKESPFEFSPNYVYLYDEKERKVILSFLEKGLWWYSLDTGDMERVSFIPKGNIPSMYIDSFKRIWVAIYNKGVFCYDREGRLQEHLETPKRLTHNIVQDMCEKDGELWLATDGGGINIYNYKNKTVRAIMHLPGDRHSLPVNSFACLYIDDEVSCVLSARNRWRRCSNDDSLRPQQGVTSGYARKVRDKGDKVRKSHRALYPSYVGYSRSVSFPPRNGKRCDRRLITCHRHYPGYRRSNLCNP